MPLYRVSTNEYHWNDPAVLYSIDFWVEGSSVKGHEDWKKTIISAPNDNVAENAFDFYLKNLKSMPNAWWECILEEIDYVGGKVIVIRELKSESRGEKPTDMVK